MVVIAIAFTNNIRDINLVNDLFHYSLLTLLGLRVKSLTWSTSKKISGFRTNYTNSSFYNRSSQ